MFSIAFSRLQSPSVAFSTLFGQGSVYRCTAHAEGVGNRARRFPLRCIRCARAAFVSSSTLGRPMCCPRARRASHAAARRSRADCRRVMAVHPGATPAFGVARAAYEAALELPRPKTVRLDAGGQRPGDRQAGHEANGKLELELTHHLGTCVSRICRIAGVAEPHMPRP
jgi:hypothetical protein